MTVALPIMSTLTLTLTKVNALSTIATLTATESGRDRLRVALS